MPLPRVAAIVVNYNGKDITLQAVESLRRMTYPNFDLVVLDNASTDGAPEAPPEPHLKRRCGRVEGGSTTIRRGRFPETGVS